MRDGHTLSGARTLGERTPRPKGMRIAAGRCLCLGFCLRLAVPPAPAAASRTESGTYRGTSAPVSRARTAAG